MRRQPPRSNAEPLPGDVRLLQATAQAVSWLAGAALLGVAALWFVRQPMFDLRSVRIDGEVTRNNVATLRAQVAHRLQGNFLTSDLQQVRTAFEDVTWVRQAVVQRVWPGRLVVHLQEHEPAALWLGREGDDSEHMVNRQGEIFEAGDSDADGAALPQLQGPDEHAARMLQMLRTLVPLLAPLNLGDVRRLQLSSHGAWTVVLDGGARIALGRGDDGQVLARTARFAQTLPRVLATYQRPLLSADLRHGDGFALRLQGLGTLAPDQVPPPPRRVAAVPAARPAAPQNPKPRAGRPARQAVYITSVLA
ncbi:MAG: polypeptide-transport-associated domain protein FtsQ-type [Pseudomonadota bacterium]|jgi:cell division protein FtsQ